MIAPLNQRAYTSSLTIHFDGRALPPVTLNLIRATSGSITRVSVSSAKRTPGAHSMANSEQNLSRFPRNTIEGNTCFKAMRARSASMSVPNNDGSSAFGLTSSCRSIETLSRLAHASWRRSSSATAVRFSANTRRYSVSATASAVSAEESILKRNLSLLSNLLMFPLSFKIRSSAPPSSLALSRCLNTSSTSPVNRCSRHRPIPLEAPWLTHNFPCDRQQ